ncbi:hypothetical protein SCALM49S_05750 [Streptomyces californicus]
MPAGRARRGKADWLPGAGIPAVLGVYYRARGAGG